MGIRARSFFRGLFVVFKEFSDGWGRAGTRDLALLLSVRPSERSESALGKQFGAPK